MKKIVMLFMSMQAIMSTMVAQNTNFGVSAGTLGSNFSHFGHFAGNASVGASSYNSFFGSSSGRFTTGSHNTAVGAFSLYTNTSGGYNTATGSYSLYSNTSGTANTGNGYWALYNNSTGYANSAVGTGSLYSNSAGVGNTAVGYASLNKNTTGNYNGAFGLSSLNNNLTGDYNHAVGGNSLFFNTSGDNNTAMGQQSMERNTSGNNNSGFGHIALLYNTTGSNNSAFGSNSGPSSGNLSNTTALGYGTTVTASNQIRLGNTSVTSIGGIVDFAPVSDKRFKKDIKEDVSGLQFINQLRPVSYILDRRELSKFLGTPDTLLAALDFKSERQTGFLAQEVEGIVNEGGFVFYGVESPQNERDHYRLRYAQFVVPLVKAIQELSDVVEQQQMKLELLMSEIDKKGFSHESVSTQTTLYQNSPNPFSNKTEIKMKLPETISDAQLIVYNLEGKQLKRIQVSKRGDTSVTISGSELSAGLYLYVLMADGNIVDTKRLVLTR